MYRMIDKFSNLFSYNKVLTYNQILKSVGIGIELWCCAKQSNIHRIHSFQNEVLRNIGNAPWSIRNGNIQET